MAYSGTSFTLDLPTTAGFGVGRHGAEWSYHGFTGPEYWADLSPEYEVCRTGQQQSPIDITSAHAHPQLELYFEYEPFSPIRATIARHTVQIAGVPSCGITIHGQWYELLELHFHTPAEHRIDGELSVLELHLVHQSADQRLAVISVLFEEGAQHESLSHIFSNLPPVGSADHVVGGGLDLYALLPENLACFQYTGSRTMPPCQEGVKWFVLKQRLSLSTTQLGIFRERFSFNARPIQRLNGRTAGDTCLAGVRDYAV